MAYACNWETWAETADGDRPLTGEEVDCLRQQSEGAAWTFKRSQRLDNCTFAQGTWYGYHEDLECLSRAYCGIVFVTEWTGLDGERGRTYACGGVSRDVEPVVVWPRPAFLPPLVETA